MAELSKREEIFLKTKEFCHFLLETDVPDDISDEDYDKKVLCSAVKKFLTYLDSQGVVIKTYQSIKPSDLWFVERLVD